MKECNKEGNYSAGETATLAATGRLQTGKRQNPLSEISLHPSFRRRPESRISENKQPATRTDMTKYSR